MTRSAGAGATRVAGSFTFASLESAATVRIGHATATAAAMSTTKPAINTADCSRKLHRGSSRDGYASSASSEPTFDTTYNRYGCAVGTSRVERANHPWSSGPDADKVTNGNPI